VSVTGYHSRIHEYQIFERILNDLLSLCSFLLILSCLYETKVRKKLVWYLVSL